MTKTYSFGYWVLRRRKAMDGTRVELADRVGCAAVTIKKIERDERRPSRQIAGLLADALAVPDKERQAFIQAARGERSVDHLRLDAHSVQPLSLSLHNLPPQTTPFIGRQSELDHIAGLLADPGCRLLTVVGPGGVGKSALSLQVAASRVGSYRHGVYMVPLVGLDAAAQLASATAAALGLELLGQSDPEQQLLDALSDKHLLLLLDNYEHLLPETGFLAGILLQAPGVTLLVTSRQRLDLRAEWVFPLTGLPFPALHAGSDIQRYDAVQLFLQAARRLRADFMLLETDWPHVTHICRLVEGSPLALELAASWTRLLSPGEIAAEIEHGVDILVSSTRDLPARHRSMRAVFDHSWKLLSISERRVLRHLSVFRGGFSRPAAEQVAGATLALLSALIDKSLLRLEQRSGDMLRFDLHELVRQYAQARLWAAGEVHRVRELHLDYFLELAEQAEPQLLGPDSPLWLDRLARDHDNLRAAISWALDPTRSYDGQIAQRLVRALMWFWLVRGSFDQAAHWAERALSLDSNHAPSRAGAVWVAGYLNHYFGNHALARQMLEQGVALSRQLGLSGKLELAWALNFLGVEEESAGDLASAQSCWEESLALWRELRNACGIAPVLINLGYIALQRGDHDKARDLFDKGLAAARASGERSWRILARHGLGELAANQGDDIRARSLYHEALLICRELHSNWWTAETIALLAKLEAHRSDPDRLNRAVCLWGAAATLYKNSGSDPRQLEYDSSRSRIDATRYRLGDEAFTAVWSRGQSMTFDQALNFALEELVEGNVQPK